ncbi:DUF805 domain-containing protein [Sphingomonas swuensis]
MSPIDYALTPFRKFATFSGRARRSEFWWFYLLTIIGSVVANLIDATISGGDASPPYVSLLWTLITFIPLLAAMARRFHDRDMTGLWVLAPVLGGIGLGVLMVTGFASGGGGGMASIGIGVLLLLALFVFMLVVMALPGTNGPNRFGDDPKASEHGHAAAY